MAGSAEKDEWLRRVLGVTTYRASQPVTPPSGKGVKLGEGRPRSNALIAPPPVPKTYKPADGERTLGVAKSPNGRVLFTAAPMPVREITFSGGGAKGNALPGAIKALQSSGVLKDAKKIAGASVGSMTAALVAAGMTAEEFDKVGNADSTTAAIVEGTGGTAFGLLGRAMKNLVTTGSGNPLTGKGLEDIVRTVLDDTIRSRIEEYIKQCHKDGVPEDPVVKEITQRLGETRTGPTFMDLRLLSKAISVIKEVVITGTYLQEFTVDDKGKTHGLQGGNEEGQLYVFDADSEPDLQVAIAVHASASFPAAFKPVDIKLSSGLTVRFIDGGVMNNTPTSSSIGAERDLDPMPDKRGMVFVFEDKDNTSKGLLDGRVKPGQGIMARAVDWFVGSENNAAEYAKNRDMVDRPEEIVEVPLQLTLPPKKEGGKERHFDMRGGTLEFNLDKEAKIGFQDLTEKATQAQIEREKEPRTREFASDSQMFMSVSMQDLKTLKDGAYAGADAAYTFRERVAEMIAKLVDALKKEHAKDDGRTANVLRDKDAKMALDELNQMAGADVDFQGYVAREMNKGSLDTLLDAMKNAGTQSNVLDATFAVADALKAHNFADNILKQLVYPKMKQEKKGGTAIEVLLMVEKLLRAARTAEEVNAAITSAVKHFAKKSDRRIPKRGHKEFAQQMQRRMMSTRA